MAGFANATAHGGSAVVLAAKPHQEHIVSIEEFIWRLCVSCCCLNQEVTLSFEHPIPCCDDAIGNFGNSNGLLCFIALDNMTGYHQIRVCRSDQEKLAFFAPDDEKCCWPAMHFGPHNAPAFCTCVMGIFKGKWQSLFCSHHPNDTTHLGSCVIIDDILLWSAAIAALLHLFACVCDVFMKHPVTFQLKKCEFLTHRIKCVSHDIAPTGNCTACSKFNLIADWSLPANGQSSSFHWFPHFLQHLLSLL
jgi:hypothetical protein